MKRKLFIWSIILCFPLLLEGQDYFKVKKLDFSTSQYNEMAPVPFRNGLIFTSNKSEAGGMVNYGEEYDLKYVEQNEEGKWGIPRVLSDELRTNYNEGWGSMSSDEKTICFVRAYVIELGDNDQRSNPNAGLYFAEFENDKWMNISAFEHNNYDYVYFSPHLTADGELLYFSSNLEDSRGGFDIYVSRKQSDGSWSVPENLGDQVNTSEDDLYPFWHSKSKRLYFSSKGHDAFGGSDIFYSQYYNNEWNGVVKLSEPINSGADDLTLIMSDDFSNGYFTSKRGGQTPNIYRFETEFPIFTLPREIQRNRFCYRLKENSLDTIDYEVFHYEWVINDTVKVPGHNIRYCFPGPGDYEISFNVYNKLTDTAMMDVANMFLPLRYVEQAVITAPDTVVVNQEFELSASETYLPNYEIDSYYWDFGDGMKDSGIEVRKTFDAPGRYKVVLGLIEKLDRKADWEPEKFAVFKEIEVLPEN